jgi:hypothetical protein
MDHPVCHRRFLFPLLEVPHLRRCRDNNKDGKQKNEEKDKKCRCGEYRLH